MKLLRVLTAVLLAGMVGVSAAQAQATKLTWTTAPTGAAPGAAFITQPVVEAQDAGGATDSNFSGPVTVSIKAGTDTGGAVLQGTTTVNAQFGVANFTDLKINLPGNYVLQATAPGLAEGDSSIVVVVTISEVYGMQLPTGVDTTATLDGFNQIRAFAVNHNPGSAYKGTMYLARRNVTAATAPEINGANAVFFWRGVATNPSAAAGSGTLKTAGPDMLHPDGKFDLTGLTPGGNAFWGIGVAGDDYVYTGGLNSGTLFRFNPDGTGGTLVIPSGFGSTKFVRNIYVTGKGLSTTIYYVQGDASTAVEKWVASAVDGNNAPTAFTKTKLFDVQETNTGANQRWKAIVNNAGDTMYFVGNWGPDPVKYSITGTKDTAFPVWTLSGGTGLDIDSQDRILMVSWNTAQGMTALSPRNGNNITDAKDGTFLPGTGVVPASVLTGGVVLNNNSNGFMTCRYSDRHYVWFQNDADHFGGGATGSYVGMMATNIPAAAPSDLSVANPGTGTSVIVHYTLPADAEVTGVNVYYSTVAGQLGTKANSSPVTGGSYEITGLTSATTYYITVRSSATDPFTSAVYESANVNQLVAVPQLSGVPDAPTSVSATDTKLGGEIQVGWTTPAQYADAIHIYRSTASGTLGTLVKTITAPTAGAPATWLDEGLTNGTPVYYTVKAANGANQESTGSAQVTATPTDQTAPTFAGISAIKDYGFPGVRVSWATATDHSPVTYKIYVASSYGGINLANPTATATGSPYDVTGLTLNQPVYILVKAVDASGNMDSNNRIVDATPNRVIIDPDKNVPVNNDKVNLQPDAGLPALVGSAIGSGKGSADDLFPTGFAPDTYFYNTNDKKGKVRYTVPINAAGTYDIAADWLNDAAVQAPGTTFVVTKPDGTVMPGVLLDVTGGGNGNKWNLITSTNLTVGTMTVLVDFTTSTDTTATNIFAAPAIRAILPPQPYSIYRAASAPTIDGNITTAEWLGTPAIELGRPSQDVTPGKWTGPADYSSNVYVKWDATNLYIAEKVTDDILAWPIKSTTDPQTLWDNDGLEVYLGLDPAADPARTTYGVGDYQFILSAYNDVAPPALTGAWRAIQPDFTLAIPTVAVVKTASGYNLEAAIPWAAFTAFPSAPAANQVIGFNLYGNDNDKPATAGTDSVFSLSGLGSGYANPQTWVSAKILSATPPAIVKGDLNGDGVFNAADVRMALQIAAGLAPNTIQSLAAGDVFPAGSPDGKIDLRDALRLNRALNGKDTL